MISKEDKEFLDSYFEEIAYIWQLFEQKRLSASQREQELMPYRKRLFDLRKK